MKRYPVTSRSDIDKFANGKPRWVDVYLRGDGSILHYGNLCRSRESSADAAFHTSMYGDGPKYRIKVTLKQK